MERIRKGAKLKSGKTYKIQEVRTKATAETTPSSTTSLAATVGEGNEYVVQAGDYPGLIAKNWVCLQMTCFKQMV
jgi:hypothetical protein